MSDEVHGFRNRRGQFKQGNPGGPGQPHAAKLSELRSALMSAITGEQLVEVMDKMLELAAAGSVPAAELVFDRYLGKAKQVVDLEGGQPLLSSESIKLRLVELVIQNPEIAGPVRARLLAMEPPAAPSPE